MKGEDIQWVAVTGDRPEWMRTAAFDRTTGEVFIPAAISGNEMQAMLCAGFDGATILMSDKHAYLSCTWLVGEYPDIKQDIEHIARRVRQHAGS